MSMILGSGALGTRPLSDPIELPPYIMPGNPDYDVSVLGYALLGVQPGAGWLCNGGLGAELAYEYPGAEMIGRY